MFAAFKERRPWAAALVTFILDPFYGMLYLNRGRLCLFYLAAEFVAALGGLYIFGPHAFLPSSVFLWSYLLFFRGVGSVHAYFVAERRSQNESLRWYAHWYSVVAVLLFAELLSLAGPRAMQGLSYRSFYIASGSMEPSLVRGDYVLVDKGAYKHDAPRRGDAVVFYVPHEPNTVYVKRIVGLPGDRVQMRKGFLYVNGAPAELRKLDDVKDDCTMFGCTTFHQYVETLPGGPAHRIRRIDMLNYLDDTEVFVVPTNNYFVLGDNRSNSRDSRMDDFGYIPRDAVIGHVAIRYFYDTTKRWTWEAID